MERCQEEERNYNCFGSKLLDQMTAIRLSIPQPPHSLVAGPLPALGARYPRNEVHKRLVRFVRVLRAVTDLISCRYLWTLYAKCKETETPSANFPDISFQVKATTDPVDTLAFDEAPIFEKVASRPPRLEERELELIRRKSSGGDWVARSSLWRRIIRPKAPRHCVITQTAEPRTGKRGQAKRRIDEVDPGL